MPPNGDNEKAEVSQWIGLVKISIAYHSPHVHNPPTNDRTGHIWGELVRYGFYDDGFGPSKAAPWRAGANESTTISFSHDVKIEGKVVFQFRCEITNVMNWVNLGNPTTSDITKGSQGTITSAAGTQRIIQLGGRLTF
jgi:hypothetical protein